jgi:hypothetical protein
LKAVVASDSDTRERRETELERVDRNLGELLAGLRGALPGVQVLFAFLLVVPFNRRFTEVTPFQEKVYFATLILTAVASALLIAPPMHHRLLFRQGQKERVVVIGNRLTIAGLLSLGLAMTGVVLLVTDFVFGTTVALIATVAVGLLFVAAWLILPLRRR